MSFGISEEKLENLNSKCRKQRKRVVRFVIYNIS